MTELTFLLELLLKHKLPLSTKAFVADRIKEVEGNLNARAPIHIAAPQPFVGQVKPAAVAMQAPSMQRLMEKYPDLVPGEAPKPEPIEPNPTPVAVVAQTPQTAAAMQSRAEAIAASMSGKVDKVTGRPRKF